MSVGIPHLSGAAFAAFNLSGCGHRDNRGDNQNRRRLNGLRSAAGTSIGFVNRLPHAADG